MTDTSAPSEDTTVTFHVKSANNAKYTLSLPLSTTAIDLKTKLSSSDYANVPAESQRLIYSGRVLKDNDTLASHNVKDGNTMHLVKSAASNQRQNPASYSTPANGTTTANPPASGVPSNIAAGTGNNPLAGLTGARYAGFTQLPGAGLFGPDGGMGPPPSQEQIMEQLQDPAFAQMMNEALQNPQVIDMMIQQNPQLRAMGPQARQFLQSEHFRRMVTDPQMLRQMADMQRMMGGMGGFGGGQGGEEAFPAPGVTNTTATENTDTNLTAPQTTPSGAGTNPPNPFTAFAGGAGGANPFANLFNPTMIGNIQQPPTSSQNSSDGAQNAQNPFGLLFDPSMASNLQQGAGNLQQPGAGNNLQNLFGSLGLGGLGGPPAPADNRPPEERYSTQLRQLNEMGFFDFDRNIQALSRSGGDVNGALEWLFSQPPS